ncbi:hypothetical protein NP493_1903g00004 [Ridgeia piscesae]|uniref:Uncharacterized protein n=1 Tax=Ridgeia piscesae TaxID=27915 RepID=A0AAD9N6S9_RIDPI|nr:hypothetical protein NP493_1903g00004 [Ridgeia piscesae]
MRSKLSPVHIPDDVSVWDFMKGKLQHHSDRNRVAFIDGPTGRRYSYRELLTSIRNVSSALLQRGFQKGDILCVISANCCQYPMAMYGVLCIGGIMTTCNPQSTVVASSEAIAKVKDAVQHIQAIKDIFIIDGTADCSSFSTLTSQTSDVIVDCPVVDPRNDIAWIFYSSGTTGIPKGVMRTHYNLIADVCQMSHPSIAFSRSPGEEVYISVLPFYHGYGSWLFLLQCMANGDTVVVYPRYNAARFIESVQTYKVTIVSVVPPIAVDILLLTEAGDRTAFASVHTIICGAAPLSADLERQLKRNTGVVRVQQAYGMTESGPTTVPEWDDDNSNGSIGIVPSNTEYKVVNPQTGEELNAYQDGELLLRGPAVMKGYFNVSSEDDLDIDHWLHTDAGVIGLPDLRAGELPAALVTLKAGMMATEAEIKAFVNEKVAPYNRLRGGVTFIEKVPRSPSGKILRRQLRDETLGKLNVTSKL